MRLKHFESHESARRRVDRRHVPWPIAFITFVAISGSTFGQTIHRQGFEGRQTQLRLGVAGAQTSLVRHQLTNEFAHTGKQSEMMTVRVATQGPALIEYAVPKCRVFDEVKTSAWVYAEKPGVKIGLKIVLPRAIDEITREPISFFLEGTTLDLAERWRRLEVRDVDRLLETKATMLQAQLKRKVDVREAYVEAVAFDVGGKPADVSILVDDVEIGPIVEAINVKEGESATVPKNVEMGDDGQRLPNAVPGVRDADDIKRPEISGERLLVGRQTYFMMGVRWSALPLQQLKEWRFNTALTDGEVDPSIYERAEKLGVKIVPMVSPFDGRGRLLATDELAARLPSPEDKPLGLYLGNPSKRDFRAIDSIDQSEADERSDDRLTALIAQARRRVGGRPLMTDAEVDLRDQSRRFEMLGVRRHPLMTSTSLGSLRKHLLERKSFARPGTYLWTWLQTHPPEEITRLTFGHGLERPFDRSVGPQPEQLRLLAYQTLSAGYRGFVATSDLGLGESTDGRTRALAAALLNLELSRVGSFFAQGESAVSLNTSHPNVKALAIRRDPAVLVVMYWDGPDSQYVLGDAAVESVRVIVHNAAESAMAYQVSPGEPPRELPRHRGLGGVHIRVDEFDSGALIVLTSDVSHFDESQTGYYETAKLAANWQSELADLELTKTEPIVAKLDQAGVVVNQSAQLLAEAREFRDQARRALEQGDFGVANLQAKRSARITRRLQRRYWESATKSLPTPISDPHATSFYSLVESVAFQKQVAKASFGSNRLPTGDFESDGNLDSFGWRYDEYLPRGFAAAPTLDHKSAKQGKRYLDLRIKPSASDRPQAPRFEAGRAEMSSPPMRVHPGQLIRVSGFVRVPLPILDSIDGAMVYDSLGGEPLSLRVTEPTDWKPFVLYRPVARATEFQVHLAITGVGAAQFDVVRIEISEDVSLQAGRVGTPNR